MRRHCELLSGLWGELSSTAGVFIAAWKCEKGITQHIRLLITPVCVIIKLLLQLLASVAVIEGWARCWGRWVYCDPAIFICVTCNSIEKLGLCARRKSECSTIPVCCRKRSEDDMGHMPERKYLLLHLRRPLGAIVTSDQPPVYSEVKFLCLNFLILCVSRQLSGSTDIRPRESSSQKGITTCFLHEPFHNLCNERMNCCLIYTLPECWMYPFIGGCCSWLVMTHIGSSNSTN